MDFPVRYVSHNQMVTQNRMLSEPKSCQTPYLTFRPTAHGFVHLATLIPRIHHVSHGCLFEWRYTNHFQTNPDYISYYIYIYIPDKPINCIYLLYNSVCGCLWSCWTNSNPWLSFGGVVTGHITWIPGFVTRTNFQWALRQSHILTHFTYWC